MRMVARSKKRLALLLAIFLAVFSTGIVIVHQCKSMSSNQVTMQHQYLDADSISTLATKSLNGAFDRKRLVDSGCVALFIVLLLCGRKSLNLRASKSRLNSFMGLSRELVSLYRPQVFQFVLSRPQLVVLRI